MNENEQVYEEGTISLGEIFDVILKNFWFLVIVTLLFGLLSAGYLKYFAKSKYRKTGALIVHVENENGLINAGYLSIRK